MTPEPRRLAEPHILICNERFLARFGVDRILVLLAEHLAAHGARVSFACLRCDAAVLGRISDRIDVIPLPEGIDLAGADARATDHILANLTHVPVDALVSGGWPFLGIAARASGLGVHSLFIDAGAVPHDGFPEAALSVQQELRRLRQAFLPAIGTILPISRFIRESQTVPDRGSSQGVTTVLLGADHMSDRPFAAGDTASDAAAAETDLLAALDARCEAGTSLILALGRVEVEGYKNSLAALDVLRRIRITVPKAHLLLLTGPDSLALPPDLQAHVTTLPTLSDPGLQAVMARCALGVSLSLWEGFNLPIAEMQWLGRPVLAFAIGAHPEVIADPWFLCQSSAEMADKAVVVLTSGIPDPIARLERFAQFRARFSWTGTLAAWTRAILVPVQRSVAKEPEAARRLIVMDVSNSARDPANSGVIRVTRRLAAALAQRSDLDVLFVKWNADAGTYERLSSHNYPFLASNAGARDWLGITAEALGDRAPLSHLLRAADPSCALPPVVFLPEVILDHTAEARVRWAREHGYQTAFILYDMLPIYEARFVDAAVSEAFPSYLAAVRASDALYVISGFSLSEFERWHRDHDARLPERREAIWLPAQFSDHARIETAAPDAQGDLHILCVSTIEPRKNHRSLIEAFQALRRRRPDLQVHLNLVGNLYTGAEDLATWVRLAEQADAQIVWHGILSDAQLAEQYQRAHFTVYPSLVEGFGLPIMESLWMGRPCLCHEGGVMAELAADGGCLTVDMNHVSEVSAALEELATNADLRAILCRQVQARTIDTWASYGDRIANRLRDL